METIKKHYSKPNGGADKNSDYAVIPLLLSLPSSSLQLVEDYLIFSQNHSLKVLSSNPSSKVQTASRGYGEFLVSSALPEMSDM